VSGREILEEIAAAMKPVRELRYRKAGEFDDVDDDLLERAARHLWAIAYSCETAARHLRGILERRRDATASSGNPVTNPGSESGS
jgi:hypothetical protein